MTAEISNIIQALTQSLFDQVGLQVIAVAVIPDSDSYQVNLQVSPEESGVLIGYHGETIWSLQFILGLMVYQQTGEWHRVVVNIND